MACLFLLLSCLLCLDDLCKCINDLLGVWTMPKRTIWIQRSRVWMGDLKTIESIFLLVNFLNKSEMHRFLNVLKFGFVFNPKAINADDNEKITILNGQWTFSKQLHLSTSQCALQQQRAEEQLCFLVDLCSSIEQRKHCSVYDKNEIK